MVWKTASTTAPTFSPSRRTMHSSMEQPTSPSYASRARASPTMAAPRSNGVMQEVKEAKEAAASAKEAKEARELEKMLAAFTVRDRKRVLDKYSVLLYNHSLEKINVEEVLDRLKEKQ